MNNINNVTNSITEKPIVFCNVKDAVNDIPSELKDLQQFTLWRWDWDKKETKWKKAPIRTRDGQYALWRKSPDTDLSSFSTCIDEMDKHECDGINFVLTSSDPYTIIDLDHCADGNGKIEEWAMDVIERFNTYTEYSPSAEGIRIILRGKLPEARHTKALESGGTIEVYDDAKTFSVTGHTLLDLKDIHNRQNVLDEWHAETFPQSPPMPVQAPQTPRNTRTDLSDQQVLDKAFSAKNGHLIESLYRTAPTGIDDYNTVEMKMLCHLAYYTKDESQLDRLYRGSGLARDKWDSPRGGTSTYGRDTIHKAICRVNDTYDKSTPKPETKAVPIAEPETKTISTIETETKVLEAVPMPEPQAEPEPEVKAVSRFLKPSQLNQLPKREWLIEDVIEKNSYVVMAGQAKHGKTFVMLDMAYSIAAGIDNWYGHKVEPGAVLIIEAEGKHSLRARQEAWLSSHPEADRNTFEKNVNYDAQSVQITDKNALEDLISDIDLLPSKPVLIVIDTLARCFVGHDENSSRDMGLFNDAVKRLQDATGATVEVLHHTGKNGEKERGSSSLRGAVNTMIMVSKNGNGTITVKCDDQKDARHFDTMNFKMIEDDESESVYLELCDGSKYQPSATSSPNTTQQKIIETMQAVPGKVWGFDELLKASGIAKSTLARNLKYCVENKSVWRGDNGYSAASSHQSQLLDDPFE